MSSYIAIADSVGCTSIPVHCGAEEALVVPYTDHEHYHGTVLYSVLYCTILYCTGLDGFNDVTLETAEPDMGRVRGEPAWEVMSRLSRAHPGQVGGGRLQGRV